MIPIDTEAFHAMLRLQLHASHSATRRIYRLSLPPLDSMEEILDVLAQDEGPSIAPPTPRDGDCPVCDARLTGHRGHRSLCPRKSECAGCGALPEQSCVCPAVEEGSPLLRGLDTGTLCTPPDAEERKRLVSLCRRAFAEAREPDA